MLGVFVIGAVCGAWLLGFGSFLWRDRPLAPWQIRRRIAEIDRQRRDLLYQLEKCTTVGPEPAPVEE